MATKVDTVPTTILELAKQGDPEAIASLIHRALAQRGVMVRATLEGERLHLFLEAQQMPDPEKVVPFIQQGMTNLGATTIQAVTLHGNQIGQVNSGWEHNVSLGQAPAIASYITEPPNYAPLGRSIHATGADPSTQIPGTVAPLPAAVEAHIQGNVSGQQVAIGSRIVQITNHGGIVTLASSQRRQVLRVRSVPEPLLYCRPFSNLLDRQRETDEALATLHIGSSVEFFGEAGFGKTALVRSLAHHPETIATFGDGVVYRLVRHQPVMDVCQWLFDCFFEYDSDTPTKPTDAELRRAFQEKHALAVLDDVYLPPEDVELLHTLPGLTLLLAAPERHVWGEVNAVPVVGLPLAEAVALVEQGLERNLTPQERPHAEALCTALKGHPLRILQTVSLAREGNQSLAVLVQLLQATSSEALTLKATASLPEGERRTLAALVGLGGTPTHVTHLAAITGIPDMPAVLATLVERGLALGDGDRYYLASNILAPLQQAWDLSQWTQRALNYFTDWAKQGISAPDLWQQSEVLMWMMRVGVETGQWTQVLQLGHLIDGELMVGSQWGAWEQVWQWGLQAGRSLHDPAEIAWALHQLGTRALCLEDLFTAHTFLTEAYQIRESSGDTAGAAVTYHNLRLMAVPATRVESSRPAAPEASEGFPMRRAALLASFVMGVVGLTLVLLPSRPPASFSLNQTQLEFEDQPLNTTSPPQTLQLTNTGTRPLVMDALTPIGNQAADFQVDEDCTDAPIPPQDNCAIAITFTPQAVGERIARLPIRDRTRGSSQEVFLRGAGTPSNTPLVLQFTPGSLTFAPVRVGDRSALQSITVTNTGANPVTMANANLTGNQANEFQLSNGCANAVLSPQTACRIQVSFAPRGPGNRLASLVLTAQGDGTQSNVAGSPPPIPTWTIPLNGTGATPTASPPSPSPTVPEISLDPPALNFGVQNPNTPVDRPLVIANRSDAPLRIGELTITGQAEEDFAIVQEACMGQTLTANQTCRLTIRFTASERGQRNAVLTIENNGANNPHTVLLEGAVRGQSRSIPPPAILRFLASPPEIEAGASTQLCYGVTDANQAVIEGVGEVSPVQDNCVTVQPSESTIYTLRAISITGRQVTGQTTVRVIQPDPGAPTPPTALTPGTPDGDQATALPSCRGGISLDWQPGTGGSRPTDYLLTLQYYVPDIQQWTTALDDRAVPPLDVTSLLTQYQGYQWRWAVRSLDNTGRQSDASPWHYFSCSDFQGPF